VVKLEWGGTMFVILAGIAGIALFLLLILIGLACVDRAGPMSGTKY
jgi:hypothetical protein